MVIREGGVRLAVNSQIEWTDATWNPVTGCTKISEGCRHCYADRMARRLHLMGNPRYTNGFDITLHHDLIPLPLKLKKPRRIFVNSMSDIFHHEVPVAFIETVFQTMRTAHWHTFQLLTKRSDRLLELSEKLPWPDNVWQGVSVEDHRVIHRIDHLRATPAKVKFLSVEPLLGPLGNINLEHIDWVIAGGESGPGARPLDPLWVRDLRDRCKEQKVAFFFKQWGGVQKFRNGRTLDGRTWDEFPVKYVPSDKS